MNEMLNGSILQDKNGQRLQIMDQAARNQAAQNAERIGELSEEIAPGAGFAKWNMPTLYLSGDTTGMSKDDAVNLAYVYGDLSGTASVKWQGSSSVEIGKIWGKFNYTIKFDTAFEAKEGWGEQKKYCFKANWIDASHARNLLGAKFWGQVCAARTTPDATLQDCPNWGAADGFPCVIVLNGAFLGLFTWNIPKDGWMMNMPHEGATQECIICADGGDATMFKALATLDGDFDVEYITDENNTAWAVESINRVISACMNSNGSDIDTVIAQYIDIDSAIDYLIHAAVIANMDGMDRNYLLSTTDGVKWRFTGYDMDTTFGLYWGGSSFTTADDYPFLGNFARTHKLMELLYAYKADAIKARYKALRNGALSEIRIAREVLNFACKIPKAVMNAEAEKWPAVPSSGVNNVYQIIEYLRMRFPRLDAEVEAMVQEEPVDAPTMAAGAAWYNSESAGAEKATITKVSFVPAYSETGSEDASWACDADGEGAIMAYRNGTEITVAPTTGAIKIRLNADSTSMFSGFSALITVDGTEMWVAKNGTDMSSACLNCAELLYPVNIPTGVTNINSAFRRCSNLVEPPVLPEGLLYINNAFSNCAVMNSIPAIPTSVVQMNYAFTELYGVTSVDGVVVPDGVTRMTRGFYGIANATGTITVNAQNLTEYAEVFLSAAVSVDGYITLTGTCPLLAELAATGTKVIVATD